MTLERRHLRGHDLYMDVWHRPKSLERFIGHQKAQWVSQIDIDCCEYCHLGGCHEPVALIETKLIWAASKSMVVTRRLANRADLPAYLVEYETKLPTSYCDQCGCPEANPENDITAFYVTDAMVDRSVARELEPPDYAEWLWSLRLPHWETVCSNPAREKMLAA